LRLCIAGTARHAADAALALHGCEELLAALDAWCGSALDWRWEPFPAAPSTDAQVALRRHDGFVHLLCTWDWLRALPPPPAALAERLHWPPVPVVVCAALLRLGAPELQQLEAGGAVVVPASMRSPWTGALRGVDEAPVAGIALASFVSAPMAHAADPKRGGEITILYKDDFDSMDPAIGYTEQWGPLHDPQDLKGAGILNFRYVSPDVPDDSYLYLPELRKVRRLSMADRSDAFWGTDIDIDSIWTWNSKLSFWTFKYLGTHKELSAFHAGGYAQREAWCAQPDGTSGIRSFFACVPHELRDTVELIALPAPA